MAARPWFRLRSTIGQPPPPPEVVQPEPPPPPQPRPAFGRGLAFRPPVATRPPPPPPPPPAPSPPRSPSPSPPGSASPLVRTRSPSPAIISPSPASPTPIITKFPSPSPPSPKPSVFPLFTTATVPSPSTRRVVSPAPTTSHQPPIALQTSPKPPVITIPTAYTLSPPAQTQTQSRLLRSPYKIKSEAPAAHPPSPLTLPPSQYYYKKEEEEAAKGGDTKIPEVVEQKTVLLVQESPKVMMPFFNAFNEDTTLNAKTNNELEAIQKDAKGKKKVIKKKVSDSDYHDGDVGMTRIITIAGENKGAIMELGNLTWTNHRHHNNNNNDLLRKSDLKAGGSDSSSSTGGGEEEGEEKHKKMEKGNKSKKAMMKAFMNSNVQGVNNSILYETSCSHTDPGLHLTLSRKPANKGWYGFGFKHHAHDHGHGHHTS